MNAYYKISEKIKELALEDPDVNTVTNGTAEQIDNFKATMFPLVHLSIQASSFTTSTITLSFTINALNQRNINKRPTLDKFQKNDNEDDNLNSMLYVLIRLFLQLKKFGEEFEIVNEPIATPKQYEFKNVLDGWETTFDIMVPIEEVTAC